MLQNVTDSFLGLGISKIMLIWCVGKIQLNFREGRKKKRWID